MDKKIIVRYHAGACGRFYACLIQTILDPSFEFEIDQNGGIHTFQGGKIGDFVYETHEHLLDCVLNNLHVDIKIIQITVNSGDEHEVLQNYWNKCLRPFWSVNQINKITQMHRFWQDTAWAKQQLMLPYKDTDPLLREILLQDMDHWENKEPHAHPLIMNIQFKDFLHRENLGEDLAKFLSVSTYDKDKVLKVINDYKKAQTNITPVFKT